MELSRYAWYVLYLQLNFLGYDIFGAEVVCDSVFLFYVSTKIMTTWNNRNWKTLNTSSTNHVSVMQVTGVVIYLLATQLHLISSQSLNLGGRRGTTDDVATIPFHPSLFSDALRKSPNRIPVHSLMLSSHLFFYLPLLHALFTVPWRIVFAMPEDLENWPYHLSWRWCCISS